MMKKYLTFFAAAVAALCITSCNKELVDATTTEEAFSVADMEIDITVGGFNGPDTKAVKTSWKSGDQINIWYDTHFTKNPDLVLVYNGTKWSVDTKASVSGAAPKASGHLNAVYVEGGLSAFEVYQELTYDDDDWCSFNMKQPSFKTDGYTPAAAMPLYTYVSEMAYYYSSNKLTATLDPWLFNYANNVQIVITDLPSGTWALKCNKFQVASSFDLYNGYVTGSTYGRGTYTLPMNNQDGKAFMFSCSEKNLDLEFTLLNVTTGEKSTFSTTGKSFDGNRLQSFRIPFNKFFDPTKAKGTAKRTGDIDVAWVQLWQNGPKFAEYNVGAADNKAEDYGGYYCWGGIIDKDSDRYYKEGGDSLIGEDDTATNLWGNNWRMPTKAEFDELIANCDYAMTGVNGVAGCTFTGRGNYSINSIFLPFTGFYDNGVIRAIGEIGYYWSSSPDGIYYDAHDMYVYWNNPLSSSQRRYYGLTVRAVLAE